MDINKREKLMIAFILILLIMVLYCFYSIKVSSIEDDRFLEEDLLGEIKEEELMESQDLSIIVHVGGAVENPGIIELERDSRVVDAIELAGGSLEDADLDSINLARKIEDEEKIYISLKGEDSEGLEGSTSQGSLIQSNKININNCDKSDLMSLPGIGEKTAEKILNYRETNKFDIVEDIMNVSGIGEKKFEAIEELIITK